MVRAKPRTNRSGHWTSRQESSSSSPSCSLGRLDALRSADIYHLAGLRKDVEQPDRARLGGNPEGMTPEQLMERYFISREVDEARRGELMEAARSVFDEVAGGSATSD